MKKTFPFLFAAACGVPLMTPLDAAAQATNEPLPAVIVIRHGDDLKGTWPTNKADVETWSQKWAPNWPTYTLPNGTSVQVHQHGLSTNGEAQAVFLAKSLPAVLEENNFLPVTRVVTKDPYWTNSRDLPTPNPFDTAWPFIKTHGITDVMLIKAEKGTNSYGPLAGQINKTVDKDLLAMLPYYHRSPEKFADSILPTNAQGIPTGSTLIVWDGQGMWGPHKTDEPNKPWYWGDDIPAPEGGTRKYDTNDGANILRLLGGLKIGNDIRDNVPDKGGDIPNKMARMYVFYPRDGTGPLATNEAPAIIAANIAIENDDETAARNASRYGGPQPAALLQSSPAGITNMTAIPPKYNLMVWDAVPKISDTQKIAGTQGWTNTVDFEINEVNERETSDSDN